MERTEIRPGYSVSKVIKGGWHLAGGHGNIDENQIIVRLVEEAKHMLTGRLLTVGDDQ